MRFAIIVNTNKDQNFAYTQTLVDVLLKLDCFFTIQKKHLEHLIPTSNPKFSSHCTAYELFDDVVKNSDLILVLGGDGSFIKTARKTYLFHKPLVGINIGNLGFLTEIDGNAIEEGILKLLSQKYTLQKRMLIDISIFRHDQRIFRDIALNDAVVNSKSPRKMIHLNTYVDHHFLEYLPGDGAIVATPTGSTAYALSAGGPLIEPDIQTMMITPICPHNLNARTCIISCQRTIQISLHPDFYVDAILTIDGKKSIEITKEDQIFIKKSESSVQALRLNDDSFFEILRKKIYTRDEKKKF